MAYCLKKSIVASKLSWIHLYVGRQGNNNVFAMFEDPANLSRDLCIAANGLQYRTRRNAYYKKEKKKARLWHCATFAANSTL